MGEKKEWNFDHVWIVMEKLLVKWILLVSPAVTDKAN